MKPFSIDDITTTSDICINVTDVTMLVNIILHGGNSIIYNMVINGADGISFGGDGNGAARTKNN